MAAGPDKRRRIWDASAAVPFLERLGFAFGLDWDESLLLSAPDDLSPADVLAALHDAHEEIRRDVLRRARVAMHVCVGGPCNGRRHAQWYWHPGLLYHLGRARWAAYRVVRDGRAFFVGEFRSEIKARIAVGQAVRAIEAARKLT